MTETQLREIMAQHLPEAEIDTNSSGEFIIYTGVVNGVCGEDSGVGGHTCTLAVDHAEDCRCTDDRSDNDEGDFVWSNENDGHYEEIN